MTPPRPQAPENSEWLMLVAGVVLGLFPATSMADTFRIIGQELTGETNPCRRRLRPDRRRSRGQRTPVPRREHEFVPAQALITMSITVNEDVLIGAEVRYTQLGPHGFTVQAPIGRLRPLTS